VRLDGRSELPVLRTAEIISGKWTLLVVRALVDRQRRFGELNGSLRGMSPRTLSLRLLERHGFVEGGVPWYQPWYRTERISG
jgi:DNA-binding HxlR family transcriptional regulator